MRESALWRIPVGILSGLTLLFWGTLILFLSIVNWFHILIWNKRNKAISEFANSWVTCDYRFKRYMHFISDVRPFPFTEIDKRPEPPDTWSERR
ncbi:MAG: DUF4389 domain-containing protein [Nanoarchaeota archaeon]|nr:DUF4389 domain-containing protein [Nanoarchaeota archaeon]